MKILQATGEMSVMLPDEVFSRNEDVLFYCKTKSGPVRLILPSVRSLNFRYGWNIYVFDEEKNAKEHKITVSAAEGDKIAGVDDLVIETNGGALQIMPVGINDWKAVAMQ